MVAASELKPGSHAELNKHCRVAIDARGVATLTMCNAGPLIIFGTPVITASEMTLLSTPNWLPWK